MTPAPLVVATVDYSRGLAAVLTAVVVPIVLSYLMRSAQRESLERAGTKIVSYPRALRVFTMLGWIGTVVMTVFACFLAKNADVKNGLAITGVFVAIMLPLHLEVFGAWITWDQEKIYTRSGWRPKRTIPLSTVVKCDYSPGMSWYRIYTTGHGIVRVHSLMSGIPHLLAILPCTRPPYPPAR